MCECILSTPGWCCALVTATFKNSRHMRKSRCNIYMNTSQHTMYITLSAAEFPNTQRWCLALVRATFILRTSSRNPRPRGDARTHEKIMMSRSWKMRTHVHACRCTCIYMYLLRWLSFGRMVQWINEFDIYTYINTYPPTHPPTKHPKITREYQRR